MAGSPRNSGFSRKLLTSVSSRTLLQRPGDDSLGDFIFEHSKDLFQHLLILLPQCRSGKAGTTVVAADAEHVPV